MLGIVIPVWLNDCPPIWDSLRRAAGTLPGALAGTPARVYLVPNRLHTNDPDGLRGEVEKVSGLRVNVLPFDGSRSVAGSWNHGVRLATDHGCDRFLITAVDCYWHPDSIRRLSVFGDNPAASNILGWSGVGAGYGGHDPDGGSDGCDFTGAMFRPETFDRAGWFDEHFRPAYFEDNDYYTRIILAGGECWALHAARFDHNASLTRRADAEAAHHCNHWWNHNHARYAAKWGTGVVPVNGPDCVARCWKHPWNDPTLPVTFWDR